jgi:Peptidase A4 family
VKAAVRTKRKSVFSWRVAGACLAIGGVCLALAPAASAATKRTGARRQPVTDATPVVLSASAAPSQLGSHGGTVTVNGRVKDALSCQLKLLSHQSFPVVFATNPRRCTTTFTAHITIGANPTPVPRVVAFELVAQDGPTSFAGLFYVPLSPKAAAPKPFTTTRATPQATAGLSTNWVPVSGGPVTLTWSGAGITSCALGVSGPQDVNGDGTLENWVTEGSTAEPCSGSDIFDVGANTNGSLNLWTFSLEGLDSAGAVVASHLLTLNQEPASATTTTPPTSAATPPTTEPPVTTSPAGPPLEMATTDNWSGYVVQGGPFSSLSGTFTVPSQTTGAACDDTLSQWVGIDGAGARDTDLIQAGVTENETGPTTGNCTPGRFYTWAWWEILPAAPTNVFSVPVHAGDSVTVTIQQMSVDFWQISLTDNSDGESFTVEEPYSGPGDTAEWVTEAAAGNNCGSGVGPAPGFPGYAVCPLAPYSPPVNFNNLQLTESSMATQVDEVDMVQGGNTVSSASAVQSLSDLLTNGFTTSYTGS